jgi:UDP-N-acetylmuramate: L-alanyl-gamma-D-glutamyl-meso-diaminopimelate ligase
MIAIGGSVMHNLALALHAEGHTISGSDDEIYNPSKQRLASKGILPKQMGWDENNIHEDLDAVILGMHAKQGNPELKKAQLLKIPIYSFPSFVAQHARNKQRVVVAGSHGKTTVTSMIMHVLKENKRSFDYLVGAQLPGFERMVQLSDAPVIVLEGDEYLSSALDKRPKMIHYQADKAVITGIAWDHINVFPSYASYLQAFKDFIESLNMGAELFYDGTDEALVQLISEIIRTDIQSTPYLPFEKAGKDGIAYQGKYYNFQIFGSHNRSNAKAAFHICQTLGLSSAQILSALTSFKGAAKRLEQHATHSNKPVFIDFAHAPSKVKATVNAVRSRFPNKKIAGILELHTYSSLSPAFLPQYKNCLDGLDRSIVFMHQKTLEIKNREIIEKDIIIEAFGQDSIHLHYEKHELENELSKLAEEFDVLLLMSSGQLGGIDLTNWIDFTKKGGT